MASPAGTLHDADNDDVLDAQNADVDAGDVDQDADAGTTDDGDGSRDGAGSDDRKPFLKVNDRTVYYAEDEARKAFDNAGRRIAALTPWEKKVAKQFGVTPDQAVELLRELAARRQGTWKDDSASKTDKRPEANRTSTTDADPNADAQLSETERKSIEWLRKRGFITKAEADKMAKDAVEGYKKEAESQFVDRESIEARERAQEARPVLSTMLSESKLPTSPKMLGRLERYLREEFFTDEAADPDGERLEAYFAGGDSQKAILTEGFKLFLSDVIEPIRLSQDANQQRNKAGARDKAGAKAPDNNAAKKGGEQKKETHTFGTGISSEDHDKAFDAFQRALKEG